MPPVMLTASKPQEINASAARALREPERHTHTILRFIGSWNRTLSSSRSGVHCELGA